MSASKTIGQCKDCKFSVKPDKSRFCIRHAPSPFLFDENSDPANVIRQRASWPRVGDDSKCGEFVQKFVREPQIPSKKEHKHKMGNDLSGPGYAFSEKHQEQ